MRRWLNWLLKERSGNRFIRGGRCTIRRAAEVHPISAVQSEYSVFSRDIEDAVIPACLEVGATLVAYSPLGRGMLSGRFKQDVRPAEGDFRSLTPRFQGDAYEANVALVAEIEMLASAWSGRGIEQGPAGPWGGPSGTGLYQSVIGRPGRKPSSGVDGAVDKAAYNDPRKAFPFSRVYTALAPPSTISVCPVIKSAAAEQRNSTGQATSTGSAIRPRGMVFTI